MLDEAAAEYQQQVANHTINAVAGTPPLSAKAACQACHRADLQIQVVTPSVVAQAHAQALRDAGYAWAPSFDAEFASIKREATVPVARIARAGYIKLYFAHNERWDVWQVMANGLTRKIMHQVSVKQYAKLQDGFVNASEPKQCSRGGANLPAHLISIAGAKNIATVWLAYTPRLWSATVLQQYAENPLVDVPGPDGKPAGKKKLRDLRGRELHPQKIVMQGEFPKTGCLPLNAASLEHNVADFVKEASPAYKKAFELALRPLDSVRIGQAQALENAVRAAEKLDHPSLYLNKSLLLMLPDDVGVIEQLNHLRLCAVEAQKAWVAGAPNPNGKGHDALRSWKLRSALHVEMIEHWVFSAKLSYQKELRNAGVYREHLTITEEELQQMRAQERATGKPYYPPGTTITANRSNPVTYRVTLPEAQVQKGLEGIARADSQSRIERYHGKLRMAELNQFRDEFKAGLEQWQAHIAKFDSDYVQWLTAAPLAVTVRHDFNQQLSLIKPQAAHGTALQQVEEYLDHLGAQEKIWGGGAITPLTVKELAKAYGKDPEAPATWIDKAMLEPWGLFSAIKSDPGKHKDTAEKINGLIGELPEVMQEALHARHEKHEAHIHSLLQVQQQAAQLQAVMLDPQRAKQLGAALTTSEKVMHAFAVHIRTAAIMNIMLNPKAERYVTIAVKLPTGETLDAMAAGLRPRTFETTLETKSSTNRQTRRQSRNTLRKLSVHDTPALQLAEFQPLMLTEAKLAELTRQAIRQGEELVDVVAEGTLGKLSHSFKLPKSTALHLIQEQASFAQASKKAFWSRQGGVVAIVGFFQCRALLSALSKLQDEEGYAYADTLMTVMGSSAGLFEGGVGLTAAVFEIKASGSKLVLASRITMAASLRLVAGIAGAASSGFDAVAAFAKFRSRSKRGDAAAATVYSVTGWLFGASSLTLLGGTTISFANATVARFAVSRLIVTRLGGAAAAELLGTSLTGIGIVVGVLGFAGMLYAESLEDDLNEVFLKRSYWGNGERSEGKFAASEEPQNKSDAEAMIRWAQRGLAAEVDGFNALSVGIKATLTWHTNYVSADVLEARIEASAGDENHRVAYKLTPSPASALPQTDGVAPMTLDKDSGHYVFSLKLPLDAPSWKAAESVRFTYTIYDLRTRVPIAQDTLEVKRG